MIWHQTYFLFGQGLAVSSLLAATPIFVLLFMLGVLRKPAWMAGLCGLGVSFLLATFAYRMPLTLALSAALNGAAFGLFPILWIIFWAIVLFRITSETGKFDIIRDSIGRLTPDPRLQALLIAFAFSAFLEGAAGFGTPVAIAATMLIGLGFSPFSASALCLLANTAPVAFGSIGIPVFTLAGITGLSPLKLSARVGDLCAPIALLVPTYLMLAVGGLQNLRGIGLALVVISATYASSQFLISNCIGPQLTDILSAILTMLVMVALLRVWRSRQPGSGPGAVDINVLRRFARMELHDSPAISEPAAASEPHTPELTVEEPAKPAHTAAQVLFAWSPYALLVACVLLWGWTPMQQLLNRATIVLPWPMLNNLVIRMSPIVAAPSPYPAPFLFNWLAAPGTACMVSTILAAALLGISPLRFLKIVLSVALQLRRSAATIAIVLAMAFLMNYSGATATLGLAFAATGALFPFFSALLGWLGVFLTGSDTSANALFGNLQVVTAQRLGFDPVLMAAANSAGGVMGKMISLQTIAVAAAATGLSNEEQAGLFRFTLRHSILLAVLTGCLALLYAHVLHPL